mgnify:CR=1 FL=1
MIELKDVYWRYSDSKEWALNDINLKIQEGEFIGIVGVNGSGKTTLAMCMNGLIPSNYHGVMKGEVNILGMNTKEYGPAAISKYVGFVFSDPESQFVTMSVEEEIVFSLENQGLDLKEIKERIDWVLKVTRLSSKYLEKPPYELSGGEKQRVAIAAALATKPKMLILDEPTSQLDPVGKQEVFDVLEQLKKDAQSTIVVIEHRMEKLAALATRMILLHEGRILRDTTPKQFFEETSLLEELRLYPPEWMSVLSKLRGAQLYSSDIPLTLEEAIQKFRELVASLNIKLRPEYVQGNGSTAVGRVIIDVEDVGFAYPDGTRALNGINLRIKSGEFVALIGQNGSGKTTLAKCIAGIYKPTEGRILVDGLDVRSSPTNKIATKVGYVFQNPDHQLFNETVFKEIAFGPSNVMLTKEEVEKRVKEALAIVGLNESYLEMHPFFLPKGLRQRVAIASILAMRPPVIIVDEPTTGQDFKQSFEIMDFLKMLNQRGHTIIIITHDMPIVARYASRVICMANGKILIDGYTREVFKQTDILAKAFVRPPDTTYIAQKVDMGIPPDLLTPDELYLTIAKSVLPL